MSKAIERMFSNSDLDARIKPILLIVAVLLGTTILATPAAQAQTLSILHAFTNGGDGGTPLAGLTPDRGGNFYGTTAYGGANGRGTVFKLTHSGAGWILNTLYTFQGNDGSYPLARVVFGPDGALYGTTSNGGSQNHGTVFRLTPPSHPCRSFSCPWMETVLYDFADPSTGAGPGYGDLAFDAAGNIYGTTMSGGGGIDCDVGDCGVVFELSRSGGGWTETVLYRFDVLNSEGRNPAAGVVLDSAGNVYGTTLNGGSNNAGALFQLSPSGGSWTATALHGFGATGDGKTPFGGLISDQQGNLYGTTEDGPGHTGTVYELQRSGDSWNYSLLAILPGPGNAEGPAGALTLDAAGNLYGTTIEDGAGLGNIFKLSPSGGGWIYTDLHDFMRADGAYLYGNVVLDAHGNLYGTASAASVYSGEVWELTP